MSGFKLSKRNEELDRKRLKEKITIKLLKQFNRLYTKNITKDFSNYKIMIPKLGKNNIQKLVSKISK